MAEVAIVTDSVACIPQELVEKYDIGVAPVLVNYEGKTYRDRVEITPGQIYSWLPRAKELPTTAAPFPTDFVDIFRHFKEKSILCITVTSKLSATFDSARIAREELPGRVIELLDSETAGMAQGFVVLAAARQAALGKGLKEVIAVAQNTIPRVNLIVMLDTLTYLVKGGRAPKVAAWASSLLQIKPIIGLAHGEVGLVARPRTKHKAIKHMLEIMGQGIKEGEPLHVCIHYADNLGEAEELKERVTREFQPVEAYTAQFTPVMGVHAGPGVLGLAFYSGD